MEGEQPTHREHSHAHNSSDLWVSGLLQPADSVILHCLLKYVLDFPVFAVSVTRFYQLKKSHGNRDQHVTTLWATPPRGPGCNHRMGFFFLSLIHNPSLTLTPVPMCSKLLLQGLVCNTKELLLSVEYIFSAQRASVVLSKLKWSCAKTLGGSEKVPS